MGVPLSLFAFWYMIFNLSVILIGISAFRNGWFFRDQVKNVHGKYAVLSEHGGWWADSFTISPVCAYIISKFMHSWDSVTLAWAMLASITVTAVMILMWNSSSKALPEPFAQEGDLTDAGWLHAFYMFAAISVILMLYIGTPKEIIHRVEALVITLVLAFHIVCGVIQPPVKTHGWKAFPGVFVQAVVIWAILGFCYWRLVH